MRTKYSVILPIAAIFTGVVLELNSLSLIGNLLPNDVLLKIWPALLIFVGLDLVISQRRIMGAAVVLFFAAALLSTLFMTGGQNNPVWHFFMKIWPVLLILFGLDCIFTDRKLINIIVIVVGIVILIYVLFNVLNIPALHNLPVRIDLSSIIPTSVFEGILPVQEDQQPQQNIFPQFFTQAPEITVQDPVSVSSDGNVSISIPDQNNASLNITPASGTVSIKAGGEFDQLLSGTIRLDAAEQLSHSSEVNGMTAQYSLSSKGNAEYSQTSNWDLSLTANRTLDLSAVVDSGYIKADLRSLNLSSVHIQNNYGPIDVMVPHSTSANIRITGSDGNIRVYVPSDATVTCVISGTNNISYSTRDYILSGNTLSPRRGYGAPIKVIIEANGSSVEIL